MSYCYAKCCWHLTDEKAQKLHQSWFDLLEARRHLANANAQVDRTSANTKLLREQARQYYREGLITWGTLIELLEIGNDPTRGN